MEWLGLLLLYLISGYMKKRHKDAKQREIESDPDWDPPQDHQPERPPGQPKTNFFFPLIFLRINNDKLLAKSSSLLNFLSIIL